MNIYFACSITGGREFQPAYQAMVTALLADGHTVPTAHLADAVVTSEAILSPAQVYERDTSWIDQCDGVIAEGSVPSHGVGYEIAYALSRGKRVLCLYREGRPLSKMISGNPDPCLQVRSYDETQAALKLIREFLSQSNL
jgi:nucleoside 2-deoxyribosyltransferase